MADTPAPDNTPNTPSEPDNQADNQPAANDQVIASPAEIEAAHANTEPTPAPADPSVNNKPNYLPASEELMAHLEEQRKNSTQPGQAATVAAGSALSDITPPANEVSLNPPPTQAAPQVVNQSSASNGSGNSFSPPQEVIDSLNEEQKIFINGASWAGVWGSIFLIAQNSLRHSAISLIGSSIPILNLVVLVFYIKSARRIAWQSHYWDSFESYQQNMSKWSKWAKIYLVIIVVPSLIGLAATLSLIMINPQSRLNEVNDSGQKNQIAQVARALEDCYTEQATGSYTNCDNLSKLASGKYLASLQSVTDVTIKAASDKSEVVAYTTLSANTVACQKGSGSPAYFSYYSNTGQSLIVCGATPTITAPTSPTPSSTSKVTPTPSRTPTPTSTFTR